MLPSNASEQDHWAESGEYANQLQLMLATDQLSAVFQPIASFRPATISGYEGLIRGPRDCALHHPLDLFDAARCYGLLEVLDRTARETIIREFAVLKLDGLLFINVRPAELLEPHSFIEHLVGLLYQHGIDSHRVVIEITEHDPVEPLDLVLSTIDACREAGLRVAIDDLGVGHSGLLTWFRLRPDYVKVDRFFIDRINNDPIKHQFFLSLLNMARAMGCKVIAEGVETEEECEVVHRLGTELVQGFHIARPAAVPLRELPNGMATSRRTIPLSTGRRSPRVGELIRERRCITTSMRLNEVVELFRNAPEICSLAVVEQGKPIGLVNHHDVMNQYAGYGRELHGRKPITQFMRTNPLISVCDCPIEQLSRQVTEASSLAIDDDFIIVDEQNNYLGMGTFVDLLQKITELQIRDARHCNPLSQLPGNVPINERIDTLLAEQQPFTLAYCDLDNFKPFNDTFGYARGDDVILTVARVLQECCDVERDFVGHVGGDDFVVIFSSEDWLTRCNRILTQIDQVMPGFYDESQREQGGINGHDRQGRRQFYPFISLSIGVVPADPNQFQFHHEMARRTSEVKRQAKLIKGCALFIDRRCTS